MKAQARPRGRVQHRARCASNGARDHGLTLPISNRTTSRTSYPIAQSRSRRGLSRTVAARTLQQELEDQHRGRSPVRRRLARALLHRRQRLPDRAARRRRPAVARGCRAHGRDRARGTASRSPRAAAARRRPARRSAPGLQLDTSKYLNRILEVNVAERWAWIEPGVVLDELNAQLRPHGLRFAPDISTASRATVGGMIANNSSGARSVLYGKTIDHVLELRRRAGRRIDRRTSGRSTQPALDAGLRRATRSRRSATARSASSPRRARDEIDRRFPKVLRRVGGYNLDEFVDPAKPFNLAKIIVGSEGTLALVVGGEGQPRAAAGGEGGARRSSSTSCSTRSAATPSILRHTPSAVEVMDRFILDHAQESPALDALRREHPADRRSWRAALRRAVRRPRRGSAAAARGARARPRARPACVPLAPRRSRRGPGAHLELPRGGARPVDGDEGRRQVALVRRGHRGRARRSCATTSSAFSQIVRGHGTVAGVYAHASVGCLHVRPVVNLKTAEGVRRFEAIANDIADLVLEFGGALSGEHGDGLVRGPFTEKMFGPVLYEAFRTVKRTFDPDGLFNPGKIVDTPPLTANLRYGAGYQTPDPPTFFDYAEYGGLGRAVEMCSGLGACRKTLEGTMCPSYMATREEKHSTRGRANTLRLAMAGRLGEAGLGDHDVHDVLDLCLECRACKAECPVGVDVARFKSEFLAGYWQRHGMPLRARARSATCTRCRRSGSRFAPLSNIVAQSGRRPLDQREAARHRSPPDAAGLGARDVRATLRKRQTYRPAAASRSPPAAQPPVSCSSTTPSPTTTTRRLASPRPTVLDAAGVGVAPRAARLLRPAADLAGAARRGARARAGERRRAVRRGVARRADPLPRAELPVGGARGRAGAAARRGAAPGAGRRRRVRAVRGLRRARMGRRDGCRSNLRAGAVDRRCCTATVIRRRWA